MVSACTTEQACTAHRIVLKSNGWRRNGDIRTSPAGLMNACIRSIFSRILSLRQPSLADGSFEKYRKKTRKEVFLEEMDQIIPWQELTAAIEPFYPRGAGSRS